MADKILVSCIAVVAALFVVAPTPTSGKCSGAWAIHACRGGNGKRSETAPIPKIPDLPKSSLSQMLLEAARGSKQELPDKEESYGYPADDEEGPTVYNLNGNPEDSKSLESMMSDETQGYLNDLSDRISARMYQARMRQLAKRLFEKPQRAVNSGRRT